MSNSSKDVNKKTHILFSHEIINIIDFDPNKIKINENSHKNILVY